MAAKKTTPAKITNKSAFVRSLPAAMSGADVVKKAKEAGLTISLAYVYGIRSKTNAAKTKGASRDGGAATGAPRGPGRPPRAAAPSAARGGDLEAAIEAIVVRKVGEILKGKLGSLLG
jgi:hypothetical protein